MPTFTLRGETYDYATPSPREGVAAQSWEYGHWPRVEAQVPLADGSGVSVHGQGMRWAADLILVRWQDDEDHFHMAWIPKRDVRKLTPSEWDIIEFHACPPGLRHIRWGKRLPGFLPE
jgi:hypothetical protein